MTLGTASNYFNVMRARNDIANNPGYSFMDRVRHSSNLESLVDQPAPKSRRWTLGDVIHGAIGAGMGAGIAKGVSRTFGLSPGFADKLETAAMGVGAAMNTGVIKRANEEEERRHAFRVGFLKAATASGLMKKAFFMPSIMISPEGLLSIPRSIANAVAKGGGMIGSAVGAADAPDEEDEKITRLQVHRELLRERLAKLRASQQNDALRDVLAKR